MDKNENRHTNVPEDAIVLGAVSIETKGPGFETEVIGPGDLPFSGISEE